MNSICTGHFAAHSPRSYLGVPYSGVCRLVNMRPRRREPVHELFRHGDTISPKPDPIDRRLSCNCKFAPGSDPPRLAHAAVLCESVWHAPSHPVRLMSGLGQRRPDLAACVAGTACVLAAAGNVCSVAPDAPGRRADVRMHEGLDAKTFLAITSQRNNRDH